MFLKLSIVVSIIVHYKPGFGTASDIQLAHFVSQSPKCGLSQPAMSVGVRSRIQCVSTCQYRTNQYRQKEQMSPCVGVNYRDAEAACDVFDQEPTSYNDATYGCQYFGVQVNDMNALFNLLGLYG